MMREGWFHLPGRQGDRLLEDQLKGLGPLFKAVSGRTVLDVGCAEGLIAMECERAGAIDVLGIEVIAPHIEVARSIANGRCHFEIADANEYEPSAVRDITLMLGILHKLKDPTAACRRFAAATSELCVIRLPQKYVSQIVDRRSRWVPHDVVSAMLDAGFSLDQVTRGHFEEWCGYFWRRGAARE